MLERNIRSLITQKISRRKLLYCNISEVILKEQRSQILIKRCQKMFRGELGKSKMWSTSKSGCEHDMLSCSDFQTRSYRSTSKIILKSCSVPRRKWSPTSISVVREALILLTRLWSLQILRWLSASSTPRTSWHTCSIRMLEIWIANRSNLLLMELELMELEDQNQFSKASQLQHNPLVHKLKAVPQLVSVKWRICLHTLLETTDRAMEQLHLKSCSDRLNIP